jgi:hypothetical protein
LAAVVFDVGSRRGDAFVVGLMSSIGVVEHQNPARIIVAESAGIADAS